MTIIMVTFFNSCIRKCVHNKKYVRGFTLVELLVSLALFTSVITIAVGALFSAQAVNARLEQTQVILDGVNLAMGMITHDIQYGSVFYCDTLIPSSLLISRKNCAYGNGTGGTVLIFKPVIKLDGSNDYSLDRVAYYLLGGVLYKDEYAEGKVGNKRTYQITAQDARIESLTFFVTGSNSFQASTPDFNQPLVTMVVSGRTIPSRQTMSVEQFSLETSISSRRFDN